MVKIRILTYNVGRMRGDKTALTRVVKLIDPDVLCVQEAPAHPLWRGAEAAFARQTNLLYVAGGRTTGDTAIFTPIRVDVREVADVPFRYGWSRTRCGAVLATLAKGDATIVAASAHVGAGTAGQDQRVAEVTRRVAGVASAGAAAAIVAGDIAAGLGTTLAGESAEFTDIGSAAPQPTFPTVNPTRRVAAIAVSGAAKVVGYEVVDSRDAREAGGHYPVLGELELTP